MQQTVKNISDYYDYKVKSYNEKYNHGYYTHIHGGVYDSGRFPFLHKSNFDLKKLGIERIKELLFIGQENITSQIGSIFAQENSISLLDCGCGHGGTAIYLAENYDLEITGITLSKQQVEQCERFIHDASVEHKVQVKQLNIFDMSPGVNNFDGIYEVEAFCQIGEFDKLFPVLESILNPGGRIVIFDNFIETENHSFKPRFDRYWRSDVSTLRQLLLALHKTSLYVMYINELTPKYIPFWKLSIAYTELLLTKGQNSVEEAERNRLLGSLEFHQDLLSAYQSSTLSYYSIVLGKK